MEVLDELSLIAELGVAFAGFLSIFLVFASRDGRFSRADSLAVLNIVASGFGAAFSALVPIVLHHLGVQPQLLWRLAAGIALCSAVPVSFYVLRRERRTRTEGTAEALHPIARIVGLSFSLLNFAIFSALVLGVVGSMAPGIYILALVVGLALGAANFISLALNRLL